MTLGQRSYRWKRHSKQRLEASLPCYQAHADRHEGHGLAAEQVLGGVVLLRAEEAKVDADEHADAQQAAEEGVIGPSEAQLLQLIARERRAVDRHSGLERSVRERERVQQNSNRRI